MTRKELVAALQSEAETIRTDAETRMNSLLEAAQALQALDEKETKPPAPPKPQRAPREGVKPSLTSLVRAIFTAEPTKTFDKQEIRTKLLAAGPSDAARINTGLYQSIEFLIAKNEVHRTTGGFQFGAKPVPA